MILEGEQQTMDIFPFRKPETPKDDFLKDEQLLYIKITSFIYKQHRCKNNFLFCLCTDKKINLFVDMVLIVGQK